MKVVEEGLCGLGMVEGGVPGPAAKKRRSACVHPWLYCAKSARLALLEPSDAQRAVESTPLFQFRQIEFIQLFLHDHGDHGGGGRA